MDNDILAIRCCIRFIFRHRWLCFLCITLRITPTCGRLLLRSDVGVSLCGCVRLKSFSTGLPYMPYLCQQRLQNKLSTPPTFLGRPSGVYATPTPPGPILAKECAYLKGTQTFSRNLGHPFRCAYFSTSYSSRCSTTWFL